MSSNKKTMAKGRFTLYVERNMGELSRFMVYAVLEWVLIILLFIDGFFAFVANEFAKLFELRYPCWLCTRIDHILVNRGRDFYYNDSICESHKKDVSYLAYCHNHKRLSDIRKMCEACLLSFATEKESDFDTYKSLVGILHKDLECLVEDDEHQIQLSVPAARTWEDAGSIEKSKDSMTIGCSCCGAPLKLSSASSYSKAKSVSGLAQAPTPSPRAPPGRNDDNPGLDLPPIRYPELKFMSDNESELPEDEYGTHTKNQKEDPKAATFPLLSEGDELTDDANRTPIYGRGNRFFGIPLSDSAQNSPRVAMRISKKSPLEKSEFALESVDGNLPNDADCDSILHRLKRQVRVDRKSLMALYMELDEERSASAVAANNAMAMITRLQAEKAAVQMEALQYQRMMEEQAEYDQEALEATYDLLAKRDDDLRVLEAEIEAYREKYGLLKEFVYKDQDEAGECGTPLSVKYGANNMQNDQAGSAKEENADAALGESLKPLKGEKTYLLGRFKKLDKMRNSSSNGFLPDGLNEDEIGNGNKAALTRQLSLLSHLSDRVKALESDTGFLEYAAKTLEKHSEGTKLLTEITQNLQKLRHLVNLPTEEQNKTPPAEQKKEQNKTHPEEKKKTHPEEQKKEQGKAPVEEQKNEQSKTPLEEQKKEQTKTPPEEQKNEHGKMPLEEQNNTHPEEQKKTPAEEQKEQNKKPPEEQNKMLPEEQKNERSKTPSEEQSKTPLDEQKKEQSKTPSEEQNKTLPEEQKNEQSKTPSEEQSKTPLEEQKKEQNNTPMEEQMKEQSKIPSEEQKNEQSKTPSEEQNEQKKTLSDEQNKIPPEEQNKTSPEEQKKQQKDLTSIVKSWF
ncbi:probable myosin-binding protein 5 [Rosa rugosa]|uniref:probable myosin-binding protein 5 n=1 Tax=Rosa rugosa TaxID=74645 RepID=UPI002B404FD2|nr:probable myosin-binding protein 5 [Rosa rugosa]